MKFLELGFNEAGMQPPKSVLEEAVRTLDGIQDGLHSTAIRLTRVEGSMC